MAEDERWDRRWIVLAVLAAFATPPVALVWLAGAGISLPGELAVAATLLPLAVGALVLGVVGRQVASSPDEPELVDRRLGEAVGMTSEEYEDLIDR